MSGGKPLFLTCSSYDCRVLQQTQIEQVRKRGLPPLFVELSLLLV
jgi:hypothetical protein